MKYGARPLRRAIQNLLENPLCEILLQENIASDAQLTADIEEEKKDGQTGSKQEDTKLAITANK